MKKIAVMAIGVAAACAAGAAVNFPLGTYIYTGTVFNYNNEVLSPEEGMTIQAVSTNGTVLATCPIVASDDEGVVYRLEVPVSTYASDKSAAIGDELNCIMTSSTGAKSAATATFPAITNSSAVVRCNVTYVTTKTYSYNDGSVDVPEDYIDKIQYLIDEYGDGNYSADGDWDGDGVDNYSEYVAGTNPFDASDYLKVTGFSVSSAVKLISFEYVGGHLYALQSAETLSNPEWVEQKFTTDTSSDAAAQSTAVFEASEDKDVDEATLYVTPASESRQMFFRVEVKK